MFKSIFLMTIAVLSTDAFSLQLTTRRNQMCGVELYESRENNPACPPRFNYRSSPACPVERYLPGSDISCPGSDAGGRVIRVPASGPVSIITANWDRATGGSLVQGPENVQASIGSFLKRDFEKETPYWSCKLSGRWTGSGRNPFFSGNLNCTAKSYLATCDLPKFGVVYQSCRAEAHGIELYETCRSPLFPVELYNSCSFYKTPEELAAYISETKSSLDTYSTLLPSRQAELYGQTRQEEAFICLIDKYSVLAGYDDVVADLVDKFFVSFGYQYADSNVKCGTDLQSQPSLSIVLPPLNCDDFNRDTLAAAKKPEGVSDGAFARFKQNCGLKISYDLLQSWFTQKSSEIEILIEDLAARSNPAMKQQLIDLKAEIEKAD